MTDMPHCCGDDPPAFSKTVDHGENSFTSTSGMTMHCRCRKCGGITKDEAICYGCRSKPDLGQIVRTFLAGAVEKGKFERAQAYLDLLVEFEK